MSRSARLRHDAPLNVVWDGNSLAAGYLSTPPSLLVANALAVMGRDVVTTNLGVVNQTWRMMDGQDGGTATDIQGAFHPFRTNVLVLWETTNSVVKGGRTAAQAAGDAQTYLQHRLAEHPGWLPILLTTLPRYEASDQATADAANATLLAADAIVRAGWRAWGAKALVDVRCPGSPFRLGAYAPSDFGKDAQLWSDTYIHISPAGGQVIANMVARAIVNLGPR